MKGRFVGGGIILLLILAVITVLFFGIRNAGISQGMLDEITHTAKENSDAFEKAEDFDAVLAKCRADGLRFDFATGKCVGP